MLKTLHYFLLISMLAAPAQALESVWNKVLDERKVYEKTNSAARARFERAKAEAIRRFGGLEEAMKILVGGLSIFLGQPPRRSDEDMKIIDEFDAAKKAYSHTEWLLENANDRFSRVRKTAEPAVREFEIAQRYLDSLSSSETDRMLAVVEIQIDAAKTFKDAIDAERKERLKENIRIAELIYEISRSREKYKGEKEWRISKLDEAFNENQKLHQNALEWLMETHQSQAALKGLRERLRGEVREKIRQPIPDPLRGPSGPNGGGIVLPD